MSDLLFATPWWLPTCIAMIGIAMFISGNARQQARTRTAGLGVVLLAVLLVVVSYLVETDKEKVTRHTHEMVAAVVGRDWTKLNALLDQRVSLATVVGPVYTNRDALVKGAQDAMDRYGVKSATITALEAKEIGSEITVDMTVFSMQDATMGRPISTGWQLDWQPAGNDWVLHQMTCVKIGDQSMDQIRSLFPQ